MRSAAFLSGLLMAMLVAGCATSAVERVAAAGESGCAELLAAVDAAVERSGVGDAQAARIPGFRPLRTDRWLASHGNDLEKPAAETAWIGRLRALDARARRAELANLPQSERSRLADPLPGVETLETRVESCAERLFSQIAGDPNARASLPPAAKVADEYRTAWRALGFYPLSSIFVGHGIADYHAQTRADFGRPLDRLPRRGDLTRYRPSDARMLSDDDIAALLARVPRDPLGIPDPGPAEMDRLFEHFAPVLEIDVVSRDDRPGAPVWEEDPRPQIDTNDPVVYRLASHVRHEGTALLQLNYVVWFPARPPAGRFDILSGHLDGLTWRVTLGRDGRPLLYDAMHNCGCYHMFFPTSALALRPELDRGALEPPLVPQQAPALGAGERAVIRIAHGTHYIERVYATRGAQGVPYRLDHYDALRSLPRPDGTRRSLFAPDGIVPGTSRAERWVIWPMGVPAPGAMRQWGHHATAFVGRRHFDDPDLLDALFVPVARTAR
ncbi:hypothetical protein SVA_2387 [Sulfurifustis variabilis]|uniref:Lipoprotein n=1 Tax=Sulfurifustis variabilis TaxID=1675686 RepID=A0A1B4VE78_9GAMM|nr:hypothetical protein [Sulfurifustis variabilis]BAU48937.1 hypothetical protein SVA_2387 [Sulfurifustis variabilis]